MWRGERLEIADPSTPLGMLQRGRGAAYLWAREAQPEEAARLVLRCLEEDPRWDRAVEDRTLRDHNGLSAADHAEQSGHPGLLPLLR